MSIIQAESAARRLLSALSQEIAVGEEALSRLQDAKERWSRVVNGDGRRGPVRAEPRKGPAVDWSRVLRSMPPKFSKELVAKRTPELEQMPLARNAALARWVRFGEVRKVGKGQYVKRKARRA